MDLLQKKTIEDMDVTDPEEIDMIEYWSSSSSDAVRVWSPSDLMSLSIDEKVIVKVGSHSTSLTVSTFNVDIWTMD